MLIKKSGNGVVIKIKQKWLLLKHRIYNYIFGHALNVVIFGHLLNGPSFEHFVNLNKCMLIGSMKEANHCQGRIEQDTIVTLLFFNVLHDLLIIMSFQTGFMCISYHMQRLEMYLYVLLADMFYGEHQIISRRL